MPRQSSDSRIVRPSNRKSRSSQVLANGITVETINVSKDDKEARVRARANAKGKTASTSQSPTDRRSFAPSVKSFNAAVLGGHALAESVDSPSAPWLQEQRRRFSSPLLAHKSRGSTDNLGTVPRQYDDAAMELRMSTQSMMVPPQPPYAQQPRSASPSAYSFRTSNGSPRDSKGWRKSFWNRSASASVVSFAHSGSMMEMHLGMSQDKHRNVPNYPPGYPPPSSGAAWPDNASAIDGSRGMSPDEHVEAVTGDKKKKKGFKKFFNALIGHHPPPPPSGAKGPRRAATEAAAGTPTLGEDERELARRESGLSYTAATAAAYQDDYSEPLAPPPPLSFLTGQQPHRRSVSSSSQSSASPVLPNTENGVAGARPGSLAVPNSTGSNGLISPSTSSSDLNRNRPSSVTSWRSSSKTGSPQSPRDVVPDSFGNAIPSIQQGFYDGMPVSSGPPLGVLEYQRQTDGNDPNSLRREKSLPALPNGEPDEQTPPVPVQFHGGYDPAAPAQSPYFPPGAGPAPYAVRETRSPSFGQQSGGYPSRDSYAPSVYSVQRGGDGWQYSPEYEDFESSTGSRGSKKSKSKSKLFGFGTKKPKKPDSPPPVQSLHAPRQEAYDKADYVPREVALHSVVRDDPEMVAYR